jgi:hypothetical protein
MAGRVRTPLAQRNALLNAFERSGLSGMKFAALHGVKYPSFANWVQQRRRQRLPAHAGSVSDEGASSDHPASSGGPLHWWEAVVGMGGGTVSTATPGMPVGGLLLHLPGGVRMEITAGDQVGWAAQLLQSMAPAPVGPRRTPTLQPLPSC